MSEIKKLYEDELSTKQYFTYEVFVRWDEMDVNGHVNYASYMSYYSEARIESMGQEDFKNLRDQGMGPVIYKAEIDYHKELFHPDKVHVVTWIDKSVSRTRMIIAQRIYSVNRLELISSANFHVIFMDVHKRKPVQLPLDLRQKFGLK